MKHHHPLIRHRLRLLLTLAWLLLTFMWTLYRVEDLGGRPLVIIWSHDPETYDPHATSHPVAQSIFRHVCEPLFYEDPTGHTHGLLAEDKVVYDDDGRRLTVHLREDIIFHDGTPLDAQAVETSFERLQHLGISPLLNDLRGVTVKAQGDDQSVIFMLPEPDYDFVRRVLSNSYAAIVSPGTDNSATARFVACTGPYRFAPERYRPGQHLTLVRNPDYAWPPEYFDNQNAAQIPHLRFHFESDGDQRLDMLMHGEGCVLSLNQEQMKIVSPQTRYRLYEATGGITYLGYNFQRPRWQDVRVRRAIAMAIDKAALAERGPFEVARTPLAPNALGYDSRAAAFGYSYAPHRSHELLTQAGFDANIPVVLLLPVSDTYHELGDLVRNQLEAVGLKVQIREATRTEILTERQNFDLLLFDYAWSDYTALGIFLGPGPRNLLGYPGGDVSALIEEAHTLNDPAQRQQRVLEAQQIVLEQAIEHPLLLRRITIAVDGTCVRGERQVPAGQILFHDGKTY
jgi:peptide/nickel transport system substrate-binding protein